MHELILNRLIYKFCMLQTYGKFKNIWYLRVDWSEDINVKPLPTNISMQILHTILNTSAKVLTGRICLTIKSFFS